MLIGFVRIFLSFLVFFYASYYDLKERIVPNKGWLIIYPVAGSVNVLSFYLEQNLQDILILMFSIFIAMVVGLLCFYSGFLGGGDVKTFIAVSLLCPTFIFSSQSLFFPFLPLSAIVNSIFLLLMISLYFFVKNVFKIMKSERIFEGFEYEPLWRKLLAMAIGYKVCGKTDWKFFRVIEKRIGGKKFFDFSDSDSDESVYLGEVWVSPIIPFIVLMFLGFMFSLFFGDILTIIIRFVGIT
ncbi:MAG: prepilin peptidase [Candidatus Baldrarchaeia archaeon]